MLTELVQYGCKVDEKMKSMLSKIKENVQGTNSDGKETGPQINDCDQKEEISIQPEQNEETRIQKHEERLRDVWNNFKCSNIRIIGVSEEEEEEQEIKNLFEKIMKENLSNLVKEVDIQVQEAQRVPNKMNSKRTTPKHIIIKMSKVFPGWCGPVD